MAAYVVFVAFASVPFGLACPVDLAICAAFSEVSDAHFSLLLRSIPELKKVVKKPAFLYNK
jgi:hypothetical protein